MTTEEVKERKRAYARAYRSMHKAKMRGCRIKCYCSHIENIENYELAKADDFIGWDVHHKLETYTSDGIRRPVDLSRAELIALGTYYDRPASELIFLKHGDHISLHNTGNLVSAETRAKISAAKRGKHHSEEQNLHISESLKGRKCSAETRAKMSAAQKRRWSK